MSLPSSQTRKSNQDSIHIDIDAKKVKVDVDVSVTHKPPTTKVKLNIFNSINNKNFEDIKKYVTAGGDVNLKNNNGYTPLMMAIQNGWEANEIKQMLDSMPNVDLELFAFKESHQNSKYGKPIDMAIKMNDLDLLNVLLDYAGTISSHKETSSTIHDLISKNSDYCVEIIQHVKISEYNEGHYILLEIMKTDHEDIFELVLKQLENIPEASLQSLFSSAALNGKTAAFVDLLMDAGDITENTMKSTLFSLAKQDNEFMFQHILEHIEDKLPIIEYFHKLHGKITEYVKYLELLGVELEEPGTIYINDVIETQNGNTLLPGETIHTDSQFVSNGHCVKVSVDVLPSSPVIVDDVVP